MSSSAFTAVQPPPLYTSALPWRPMYVKQVGPNLFQVHPNPPAACEEVGKINISLPTEDNYVEIYWSEFQRFFPARVIKVYPESNKLIVRYLDDGSLQEVIVNVKTKWNFIAKPTIPDIGEYIKVYRPGAKTWVDGVVISVYYKNNRLLLKSGKAKIPIDFSSKTAWSFISYDEYENSKHKLDESEEDGEEEEAAPRSKRGRKSKHQKLMEKEEADADKEREAIKDTITHSPSMGEYIQITATKDKGRVLSKKDHLYFVGCDNGDFKLFNDTQDNWTSLSTLPPDEELKYYYQEYSNLPGNPLIQYSFIVYPRCNDTGLIDVVGNRKYVTDTELHPISLPTDEHETSASPLPPNEVSYANIEPLPVNMDDEENIQPNQPN
jgi:hypothetical protein